MVIHAVIETDEDGWYIAHVPAFRGCWSQGRTRDEALQNIREAAELWLEVAEERSAEAEPGTPRELVALVGS